MEFKYVFIIIAKYCAKLLYFFLKLFPTQNKIVLISRFNKETSVDFLLLEKEIKKRNSNTKIVILNHKLKTKYHLVIDVLIEMYNLATSKAAIIDSYIIPVSILKHKKNLKIIQIWHSIGVSKRFGYTALGSKEGADTKIAKIMNMHKNYDYLIASGKTSIKYYKDSFNIQENKIYNIGIPRIDYLVNKENKNIAKLNLINKYPQLEKKKNILYAPTFRKGKKIPYENLIKEFDFENYNLIIKQHHLDKTRLTDSRILNLTNETIFDLLFITDYLITDYSALMFEAALLNVPMFFYTYDSEIYQKRRGLTLKIDELPGYKSDSIIEIFKAIKENNYSPELIEEFKNKHIDNIDGMATKRIIDLIEVKHEK